MFLEAIIVTFIINTLFHIIISSRFILQIQKHHHELWANANMPSVYRSVYLTGALPLHLYLLNRKYRTISNQNSIEFAEKNRRILVSTFFVNIALLVLLLVVLFSTSH